MKPEQTIMITDTSQSCKLVYLLRICYGDEPWTPHGIHNNTKYNTKHHVSNLMHNVRIFIWNAQQLAIAIRKRNNKNRHGFNDDVTKIIDYGPAPNINSIKLMPKRVPTKLSQLLHFLTATNSTWYVFKYCLIFILKKCR